MSLRLLLIADDGSRQQSISASLQALGFEVVARTLKESEGLSPSFCTIAVADAQSTDARKVIRFFRQRRPASKLLALVPFAKGGMERELVDMGADDALTLPVNQGRLEVTLRNLLRLHTLERACSANYARDDARETCVS